MTPLICQLYNEAIMTEKANTYNFGIRSLHKDVNIFRKKYFLKCIHYKNSERPSNLQPRVLETIALHRIDTFKGMQI